VVEVHPWPMAARWMEAVVGRSSPIWPWCAFPVSAKLQALPSLFRSAGGGIGAIALAAPTALSARSPLGIVHTCTATSIQPGFADKRLDLTSKTDAGINPESGGPMDQSCRQCRHQHPGALRTGPVWILRPDQSGRVCRPIAQWWPVIHPIPSPPTGAAHGPPRPAINTRTPMRCAIARTRWRPGAAVCSETPPNCRLRRGDSVVSAADQPVERPITCCNGLEVPHEW